MWNLCSCLLLPGLLLAFVPSICPQESPNEGFDVHNSAKHLNSEEKRNHLPLLSGRTKNSVTQPNSKNETNICFPYFIAQDVDALLAQASKMLNKPLNPRQKSWLQLFVHRLDSLSKQLRSLPVEHRNMCFQTRERLLSGTGFEERLLEMTPEEVELRFAKQIFDVPNEQSLEPKDRPKHYVLGKISKKRSRFPVWPFEKRMNFDPRARANKYVASVPQQSAQSTDVEPKDTTNTNIASTTHGSAAASNYNSQSDGSQGAHTVENKTSSENQNTQKSVGKPIPWQILEKLKYEKQNRETQTKTLLPEEPKQPVKQEPLKKTETPTVDQKNEGPTHSEIEARPESIVHKAKQIPYPVNLSIKSQPSTTTSNNYDEDEVVMQLHAGLAGTPKAIHPISSIITTATSPPPSYDGRDMLEPMGTRDKTEITEPVTNILNQQISDGQVDKIDTDLQSSPSSENEFFDESGTYSIKNNNEKNLDFDYEEQGAAIGELYTEEDNSPVRQLAIPSSVERFKDTNQEISLSPDIEDDVVLQLRALKSPSSTETPTILQEDVPDKARNQPNKKLEPLSSEEDIPSTSEPSRSRDIVNVPINLADIPDKVIARIAGPAGRVHRRSLEVHQKIVAKSLHVDDKK